MRQGKFANKQIFVVPAGVQPAFETAWAERQGLMQAAAGFERFDMQTNGEEYTVVSEWTSIPEWEVFNLSKPYRRSHMPTVRVKGWELRLGGGKTDSRVWGWTWWGTEGTGQTRTHPKLTPDPSTLNSSSATHQGIWQKVPKPGEGFPEDFVPFLEMNTFVQAKY